VAELIALGMVKLRKMLQWIIRSQVLRVLKPMDAVHRLNGSGCVSEGCMLKI
jgi:hypothetical protein